MKKNLLYSEAAESIISRVENLQATNKNVWGTMNATEMLLHVNLCNEEIFDNSTSVKRTTIRAILT